MKRKQDWVKRYAKIDSQVFTYKKTKQDKDVRQTIDLRLAKIKYSARAAKGEHYIQLQSGSSSDLILIEFTNPQDFDRWVECFKENTGILKK